MQNIYLTCEEHPSHMENQMLMQLVSHCYHLYWIVSMTFPFPMQSDHVPLLNLLFEFKI